MNTSAIVAIIMGVLMMVLSFVLFPTLNSAMDDLMLYWVDSCELNNERFVRAYVGVDTPGANPSNVYIKSGDDKGSFYESGLTVSDDSGVCEVNAGDSSGATAIARPVTFTSGVDTAPATYSLYNERGKLIGRPVFAEGSSITWSGTTNLIEEGKVPTTRVIGTEVSATTGAATKPAGGINANVKWIAVPSILDQFGGIGRLVLSVMPIMVLASFLALVAMGLIEYGRGMSKGGIAGSVGAAIIQLIVVIVLLEVLPTVIDAMVDANQSATGGSLTVNQQFSGIMAIIFAALPLLLVVGILGISGFMLFQKGRSFRGSGGFSLGG